MASRSSLESKVGAQIRAIRLRRDMSLAQVGVKAGLSRQGVQRIEAGEVSTPVGTLERIAGALGVPVVHLFAYPRPVGRAARRPSNQTPDRS